MKLNQFLEEYGQARLAKKLDLSPSTISHWHTKRYLPRRPVMLKLEKLSGGRLTISGLVYEFMAVSPVATKKKVSAKKPAKKKNKKVARTHKTKN